MTIKELCNNQELGCKKCPFNDVCTWLDCDPLGNDEDVDKAITKSIIETARILTEGNNHGTSI